MENSGILNVCKWWIGEIDRSIDRLVSALKGSGRSFFKWQCSKIGKFRAKWEKKKNKRWIQKFDCISSANKAKFCVIMITSSCLYLFVMYESEINLLPYGNGSYNHSCCCCYKFEHWIVVASRMAIGPFFAQ